MAEEFLMPESIFLGENALGAAEKTWKKFGRKAMIVTDQTMIKLGNCGEVEAALKRQGIGYFLYEGIGGEPTDQMVEAGEKAYLENGCDFLIGLGGGSPLDAMKGIGAVLGGQRKIASYMGEEIETETPPMVAVPTTAGTGSEATRFAVITDTEREVKMLLKGKCLMPRQAVADPRFAMTLPPEVTAATGLDALCHAVEAYTSRKAQPLSDLFALSAAKRIFRFLPEAFLDGSRPEARREMCAAALEAGVAFNNSSVTLLHGMSRPFGALFHVPHGLSNAMLMKETLEFALEGAAERFACLGKAVWAAGETDTERAAAGKFLEALEGLLEKLKIPSLREYGIDLDRFERAIDKMTKDAMESQSPQNTRRQTGPEEVKALYRKILEKNRSGGQEKILF